MKLIARDGQNFRLRGDHSDVFLPHRPQYPGAELAVPPAENEALSPDGGDDDLHVPLPGIGPELLLGDVLGARELALIEKAEDLDGNERGHSDHRNHPEGIHQHVAAQRLAAEYLAAVAPSLPERLYVGGHSKGGNLATYAALMAPEGVRARIERVFDHDGPGFKPGFLDEKDFEPVRDLVHRTVPEESVVGMLMDTPIEPHVVRSSARGAEQHSVFTWEVDGDDFAYADGLSPSAVFTHDLMDDWLSSLSEEETPRVVDALFRAIEASGARSFGEVIFSGPDTPTLIGEAARNLDQESRDILTPALAKLAASAARAGARGLSELF